MRRFEGKVVLVVGGGRGMGRVVAESFVAEGATVVITARDVSFGEKTVAEIKAKGGKAFLVKCDLTDRASMKNMAEEAARLAGGIDIAVLSAASFNTGLVMGMTDEAYDELVRSNIHAIFWLAKDVAPYLSKAKDKGRLLYIGSGSANRTFSPGLIPYAASKAYMNAFARGLAVEFGPMNILVNVVEPGMTATDRLKEQMPIEFANAISANFPIPRVGESEDIAKALLFLASNDASYITGASLLVDGGATMAPLAKLEDQFGQQ